MTPPGDAHGPRHRTRNLSQLNLDAAGVKAEPGAITVDDYLRTNVEHIFAAGDGNGHSMLVQTARMEGRIAARNAVLGPARQATCDVVPSGSFTDPGYGRAGLTETQAARHHDIVIGIARYNDLLRPVADGRPEGLCKLIADRRGRTILGAHVAGEYSAETVQTVAAAMAAGMTVEQVAELQLAYPTFTRRRQHGRPEDLPGHRDRALPPGLGLSGIRGMNPAPLPRSHHRWKRT